ncbi:transglycosylase domain-containing protein [Mycolicibacterium aichiense]|uniref:Penicillin-binding protein 1A n=1 Tax=Mycolicibacterium aichiense TaxID=1799 RepID=A0AAD1HSD6_9MYCO|nr:transglycosylase domain-containing protein [Mycolicibacterium aichiense]MCV7020620.1 penicillin-binding protein [Mycolicibacterium aichiense]BBX10882.1 penicillin-binding protein 1A [Mycolicibacterium aichiense]STZ25462.1 membrane carboxypeptidase (penicillin-binding protein) [Mycolicibacterium aichiense]
MPPDDRLTSIIEPVRDTPPLLRDPVDVVKAALDGTPPPKLPPPPPRRPGGSGGPGGPPPFKPPTFSQQVNWKWVRRSLYLAAVVLIVLPLITFGMAYLIVKVPQPGDLRTNQVSTILASDGSELAKIVPPEGNRVDVNIDQVPVQVRNAVMAAEDRDFYSNPGFSFTGFARALKNNLFGGDLQGGSTITQQYVKNALVGDARSGVGGVVRKAKELVISTKMTGEWSKDQVLQAYLNIIYFGRGAYGIAAASKAYFDKPVEQLTVAEGALLAALIQRPSTLDPAVDPDGAAKRWNWVLDGMVSMGALSKDERSQQVFPPTVSPEQARSNNVTTGPNGLIERQVTKELLDLFNIDEQTLNTQGLQITTTIDPQAQKAAEDAVSKYLDGEMPDMRSAVVSIDPKTGGVKAYYGGSDAQGFDFAQAGLPTGSSFKVFALVAALEQGMGLGYQVDSSPVTVNGIKITNVEGEGCGVCNIAEALKRSLNTSYYRLMLKLKNGPSDVADAAHRAGIAESFPGVEHTLSEDGKGGPPNNGVVLGQYQSRVLDMASAYATLADSGVYHKPHFVQKVVNSRGEVLFDASTADNSGEQRIPKAVADNVTAAMQPIAGYSRGHNLAGGRPSAAKTGTNQLGDTDANRDAWMVGYTPSLSTAVWVGTTDGTQPLVNSSGGPVYGSGLPSDIWKATMDGALKGTDNESFPKPTEIGGYAGVPAPPPPPPAPPSETVIQPSIEVAPGITIPLGPPTTITIPPGGGPPPPPGGPEPPPPGGGDPNAPLPPPP